MSPELFNAPPATLRYSCIQLNTATWPCALHANLQNWSETKGVGARIAPTHMLNKEAAFLTGVLPNPKRDHGPAHGRNELRAAFQVAPHASLQSCAKAHAPASATGTLDPSVLGHCTGKARSCMHPTFFPRGRGREGVYDIPE
jgi:hypothetical protein